MNPHRFTENDITQYCINNMNESLNAININIKKDNEKGVEASVKNAEHSRYFNGIKLVEIHKNGKLHKVISWKEFEHYFGELKAYDVESNRMKVEKKVLKAYHLVALETKNPRARVITKEELKVIIDN